MNTDNYSFGDSLSADEQAVLDHVSGLTSTLPQANGYSCEDRQIVGELMAQREQLSSLAISPPPMKSTFDDLINRIDSDPEASAALEVSTCTSAASGTHSYKYSPFLWLTSKWGIGFVAMSSIVLTFVVGWLVNRARDVAPIKRYSQFHAKKLSTYELANGQRGVISRSNIAYIGHSDPVGFSSEVTRMVTNAGGEVTILTRRNGIIQLLAYVPERSDIVFAQELLAESNSFESRVRRAELSKHIADAEQDLVNANTEFEELEKLPTTPDLATELAQTAESISNAKARVKHIRAENRYAEWTWQIAKPERPLNAGLAEGLAGLKQTGNWLISSGITGLPIFVVFMGFWLTSRVRKRVGCCQ